jgi:hypothetical protein
MPGVANIASHDYFMRVTATFPLVAVSLSLGQEARNPSHVYARVLKKAIEEHLVLDHLHLGDVLIALRNSGFTVDRKTGLL